MNQFKMRSCPAKKHPTFKLGRFHLVREWQKYFIAYYIQNKFLKFEQGLEIFELSLRNQTYDLLNKCSGFSVRTLICFISKKRSAICSLMT
jgi:hypothetical protein